MPTMGLAAHAGLGALMGQINPFTGAVPLQTVRPLSERLRRQQDEGVDHAVENPDAVVMISQDQSRQSPDQEQQPKQEPKEEGAAPEVPARLDVTA